MDEDTKYVPRVLVIDDNIEHVRLVQRTLEEPQFDPKDEKFKVAAVMNPEGANQYIETDAIDIYLVDLKFGTAPSSLEDSTQVGKNLISRIRYDSNAAIVVYSGEREEAEAVSSLSAGADAYIWKTSGPAILKAKVCALWRTIRLRRPLIRGFPIHENRTFNVGSWKFVIGNRIIESRNGRSSKLSRLEYALLRHLVTTHEHEIDREGYFAYILGRKFKPSDRSLDSVVNRLRSKLGDEVEIISVRDVGYRLLGVTSNEASGTLARPVTPSDRSPD